MCSLVSGNSLGKPKGAPAWIPDKIWKPIVKKVGVEKMEGTMKQL
jgi:hypothetical protein